MLLLQALKSHGAFALGRLAYMLFHLLEFELPRFCRRHSVQARNSILFVQNAHYIAGSSAN